MKNLLKENNGGGISIERYDENDNLVSVFTGLEFSSPESGIKDFITYGTEWDYDCAGGNTNGYHQNGNVNGDLSFQTGEELNCYNVADDSPETKVISEYDDQTKTLTIHTDCLGFAGAKYLDINIEN